MAVLSSVGVVLLVAVHVAITVVLTRFFRLQLDTDWAAAVYTALFVPIALVASTLVLSGVLGLGDAVQAREVALVVAIVLPMAAGVAIDLFWMPAPEDVELPESA